MRSRGVGLDAGTACVPLSTYYPFHTRICRPVGLSQIVLQPDALDGVIADRLAVRLRKPDRPADAGVKRIIGRQRHADDAGVQIGLHEIARLARRRAAAVGSDIERGVRPGGLRQVLDDAGDTRAKLSISRMSPGLMQARNAAGSDGVNGS